MTDRNAYTQYSYLIEYEWAPINRLGLEVEIPVNVYGRHSENDDVADIPVSKVRGLKVGAQYTFISSERFKFSSAVGYLHEWEMAPLHKLRDNPLIEHQVMSPFWVLAKRWGNNFHSLVYQGPIMEQSIGHPKLYFSYQFNTNLHYMIRGTRNFVGLEINQIWAKRWNHTVFRPQMRLCLSENLMVGIVAGVSTWRQRERFSSFLRLIYEPKHPVRRV